MLLKTIVPSHTTFLVLLICTLISCNNPQRNRSNTPVQAIEAKPTSHSKIVGLLGSTTIRRDDLWLALIEFGGEEVIEEYVLTLVLEQTLKERGITITPTNIEQELHLLRTLSEPFDEVSFDNILKERGIGQHRKSTLLWRNAALRKLIQSKIQINEDAVHRMFAIIHGVVFPTRIIVVSTLKEANEVKTKLANGLTFSDAAIEYSIDSSADRGGRVSPISPSDPVWPSPIREAITSIGIDLVSDPIFIRDRWVILKVTGEPISSDTHFEDVRSEMKILATLAQERFYMEELSRWLQQENTLKILDLEVQKCLRSNRNSSK